MQSKIVVKWTRIIHKYVQYWNVLPHLTGWETLRYFILSNVETIFRIGPAVQTRHERKLKLTEKEDIGHITWEESETQGVMFFADILYVRCKFNVKAQYGDAESREWFVSVETICTPLLNFGWLIAVDHSERSILVLYVIMCTSCCYITCLGGRLCFRRSYLHWLCTC